MTVGMNVKKKISNDKELMQNRTYFLVTFGEAVTSDLNGLLKRIPWACVTPGESGKF